MVRKVFLSVMVLCVFALAFVPVQQAFAFGHKGGEDYGKDKSCYGEAGCGFYKTIHHVLYKKKELDLSADQVNQIKLLVKQIKKDNINMDAQIKTLKVEIDTMMWEFPFETEGVNDLVAQKYDLKKQKAQRLVAANDKLKAILTSEQLEKLKTL
ncbi:MAG: hypothetical protein ABIH09_01695 [Candidatus Omnitrophota bacterium]